MMAETEKRHSKRKARVDHDADDDQQQRHCSVFSKLLADLRADKLDAAQTGAGCVGSQRLA
jgi:hypothetical protein